MLATLHRAPILAAVGLLAVALAHTPRSTPTAVLDVPAGCPVAPVVLPAPIMAPARLIYISGPDRTIFTPADHDPALR